MDKKLADYLFSARWGVKAGKPEFAFEQLTEALIHIGSLKATVDDVERDQGAMPEDFQKDFVEPTFVELKGVKYRDRGAYKTDSGQFKGLVVHYTVSGRTAKSAQGNVNYLASKGLGCMVMDEDGIIYYPEGFDILKEWGSHAGLSRWGNDTSISDKFAGMEICGWGRGSTVGPFRESNGEANIISGKYQAFTEAQEKSLFNFCKWAKSKNPEFLFANVVGHDEVRAEAGKKGDKTDPGASLSMTMPMFRANLAL